LKAKDLLRGEILEYLVPNFQEVKGNLIEEWMLKVLTHVNEGIEHRFFCKND